MQSTTEWSLVLELLLLIVFAWFLLRWKRVIHRIASTGKFRIDPFTVEMVGKIFTIVVVFLMLLMVMALFGLNIAPLVTFGGIGAAVLGIAGKDVIANFFGGFMIYLTRPFMTGDQIELGQRNIVGNVEEIGWYFTSVRDGQKKPIYIPNSVFSTEPVMNLSRMTHRRIEESIAVRYEDLDKLPRMMGEIRAMIEKHSEVDRGLPLCVYLEKFGDSAVHMEVKVYLRCTRYEEFMEVRQELLSEIYRIVRDAGAEMPYPTMQVKIQQ